MLSFASDYIEGAHPAILQRLIDTNFEKLSGYGDDRYTESAKEKIKAACGCPGADVWFLVGGTQTNQVIISSLLEANEGVVAADTGHVSLHEAGAIEVVACCVDSGFRRKHIASAMLTEIINEYPDRPIELTVLCDNEGAVRLYEKLGFEKQGDRFPGFSAQGQKAPWCWKMLRSPAASEEIN